MIKVARTDKYRSRPFAGVNDDYDKIRVTMDMPIGTWKMLKKFIIDSGYFDLNLDVETCEKHGIKGDYEE